jgi:outer membrane murein-binding lipoprotein Lpp
MTTPTLKQDVTNCPLCGATKKVKSHCYLEYACGTSRGAKDSQYLLSQTIECKISGLRQQRDALADELIAAIARAEKAEAERDANFKNVSCSQCGRDFGPGNHGYSHCIDHTRKNEGLI